MTKLIIINGGMGSGKSTISKLLSNSYSGKNYYIKADDLICGFCHIDDIQQLQELVFDLSQSMTNTLLESNITVIVEKVMNKAQLENFLEIGKIHNVEIVHIILKLPLDLAINRVIERRSAQGKSINKEYLARVTKSYLVTEEIIGSFNNQHIFSTETESPESICKQIINLIDQNN